MNYIDLTHPVTNGMPVYPGDRMIDLMQTHSIQKDGYTNFRFSTGMHAGTHIDGPFHMIESDQKIGDIAVDRFIGPGILIDLQSDINPLETISRIQQAGYIALLYTGFDRNFYTPDYYTSYPSIDPVLIKALIRKKVKMIGFDTPSPDYAPFDTHKAIFEAGIFIIENLTNMEKLTSCSELQIIALPLKLMADSSPARVIAITM